MKQKEFKRIYKPRWLQIDMARHSLGIKILEIADSRTDNESGQICLLNDRVSQYGKIT